MWQPYMGKFYMSGLKSLSAELTISTGLVAVLAAEGVVVSKAFRLN